MAHLAEPALVIHLVDEHEEHLQDQALVFVAARHLDHEEEDAEVVEVEPLHHLLLREEALGDPFVDFALHGRLEQFVGFWADHGRLLADLLLGCLLTGVLRCLWVAWAVWRRTAAAA